MSSIRKRSKTILFFIFLSLFAFGPSYAFWPAFQGNNQRNGSTGEYGPLTPGILWSFEGAIRGTSAVAGKDGAIYFAGRDIIYAVAPGGKEKWRYRCPDGFASIPAIAPDGTLYIAEGRLYKDEDAYLTALSNDDGAVKWRVKAGQSGYFDGHRIAKLAVTSSGRIYLSMGTYLSAYDGAGKRLWIYNFPADEDMATSISMSPDEKTVYIYKRIKGVVYAISQNGSLVWRETETAILGTDFSSPAVAPDGTIYLISYGKHGEGSSVHALTSGGKKKWTQRFPALYAGSASIAIGRDGTLYVDIANDTSPKGGAIYALSPKNGRVKWKFKVAKKGYGASPVSVDGRSNLYFAAGDGNIYCLNPDGGLIWKYPMKEGRKFYGNSPAISGEVLYVIDEGERAEASLFAIGAISGNTSSQQP